MKRNNREQPVSEINITPLTDVMLVLLVIFMISSPVLMAKGIEVHLPQVEEAPALVEEDHVLQVTSDHSYWLDGVLYEFDELRFAFSDMVEQADIEGEGINLFLKADRDVIYGHITEIMSIATESGIEQISLVQEILTATDDEPAPEEPVEVDVSPQPTEEPIIDVVPEEIDENNFDPNN